MNETPHPVHAAPEEIDPTASPLYVAGRHDGRVVIITGASRGIGRAVAQRLAAEGARVVVAAKSAEPHPQLPGTIHDCVDEIKAAGGEAVAIQVDVREEAQLEAMVNLAIDTWGRVDALFNNAGAIYVAPVIDTPLKKFDLMMSVNVRATFAASRLVLPHMVRQQWGHILAFSPALHADASPGDAAYMVSKLGMTRIVRSIAEEHRDDNIAANALWPMTMIDSLATRVHGMGDSTQWRRADIICDTVAELFSREPSSCTGRELTDEDVLKEAGVTDFDRYWVEGAPPEHPILLVGEGAPLR